MSLDDEDIHVKIENIAGHDPKYGAWSIDAKAWMLRDGERCHEKTVKLNVLKEDGELERDDDGVPHVVHRIKESYRDNLKECSDVDVVSSQQLDEEHRCAEEMQGEEFSL